MCVECKSGGNILFVTLLPSIRPKVLNLESEVDRRKIHVTWCVPFMDANQVAAARFYFTNLSDIIHCVSCGV